jgi:hypothetical protein
LEAECRRARCAVVDSNYAALEQTIDFQTWVPRTVCLRRTDDSE